MSERACTHGHVIDEGKENCQRCGASAVVAEEAVAVDEIKDTTAIDIVEENIDGVDNELSIENEKVADEVVVPENGSTEPENPLPTESGLGPVQPLADAVV